MRTDRQKRLDSFGSAYPQLTAVLAQIPEKLWAEKMLNGWNIHQILVHLADAEANGFVRLRALIAEPGKRIMAYDQEVWAKTLYYDDQDARDAVQLFKLLREASYRLILKLPESVWSQTIEHPEQGTLTLDDWLDTYEDHVVQHIDQIHRAAAALAAS
ncbi:MAG TPA: DinB family protein [Aggregatilineales bacterium]|nr:DinB family protein [Aggregatilineales bacterium]